ncbi:hypothetical protein [Streptomyces sp. NPDC003393]
MDLTAEDDGRGEEEAVVAVDGRARCSVAKSSFEGGCTLLRVRRAEFTIHRG